MQPLAGRNAFDGLDLCAFHLAGRHQTAINNLAVDEDCARAALAFAAAFFGSG